MSIGEDRVRTKFNPSANSTVEKLKQKSAELIDLCNALMQPPNMPDGEAKRCLATAMTHYEDAAMWAVKGATHPTLAAK